MNFKKLIRSKGTKYGTLSAVFIIAFIALVLALNLVVGSLSSRFNLTVDLSAELLYSVGEDSRTALSALWGKSDTVSENNSDTMSENDTDTASENDLKVTIYFLTARDKFEYNAYALMVRELAEEYARVYPDNISVEYIDVSKDPKFAERIYEETQTSVTVNNIIISGKYHKRVLALDAFFRTDEGGTSYVAFDGERRFTAGILQSCIKDPQEVAFTTGHGEPGADGASASLRQIYIDAGFTVTDIDLSAQEISADTRILVVYKPTFDFLGYTGEAVTGKTEIEKISEYVNDFKSLVVMVDASTPPLPNLQEYLHENWGIGYKPYHKISDQTNSVDNSFFAIKGAYVTSSDAGGGRTGAQIHKTVTDVGSNIPSVFRNAVELYTDAKAAVAGVNIETSLKTYPTAKSIHTGENGESVESSGEFPLLVIAADYDYGDNNAEMFRHVILSASTDFASERYLGASFGNKRLVLGAARIMSTVRVNPDIDYKLFVEQGMTLTTGQAYTLTWVISAILPAAIIITGVVVFLRRRHL